MRRAAFALFLPLAACDADASAPGCLELPAATGEEVARVGDVGITVDQIVARVNEQGTTGLRRYSDRKRLRELVEDQIRFELLVRAGLERGLAQDPDVVQAARQVLVRKLLQRDLGPSIGDGSVSEAQIERYYQQHQQDYQQPEKRRLLHIQLAPTDAGKALGYSLLQKLKAKDEEGALFRLSVERHSLDAESRAHGGELPFLSREELTEELGTSFATEVFEAPQGQVMPDLVQSTRGWHVVKVVARRDAVARNLEEVKEDIRDRLLKGHRAEDFEQYLAEIRQRHPVALYEERLDHVLARISGATAAERR
jgi:hypothetical protein